MPAPVSFTVACAWSELLRLEASKAPRDKINAQRRHAKSLTRRWSLAMSAEVQAARGRDLEDGSITGKYVVSTTANL